MQQRGPGVATMTQQGTVLLNYNNKLEGLSVVVQLVKNLPAMQETLVQSLGWKDALEKETATYSSILVRRIPWAVKSMGSQKV